MRVEIEATLYDGRSIPAISYMCDQRYVSPDMVSLPGERHIDIIARGCEFHGVHPEYIQWLRSRPMQPRRARAQYRTFPVPPDTPTMQLSDITGMNGVDERQVCVVVNGKVLKVC